MLYKPWDYKVQPNKQPSYQPVSDCTYWPILGSFNNCNIIKFTNKTTSNEDFGTVHKVVPDGISENNTSLKKIWKYGDINAVDSTKMGIM